MRSDLGPNVCISGAPQWFSASPLCFANFNWSCQRLHSRFMFTSIGLSDSLAFSGSATRHALLPRFEVQRLVQPCLHLCQCPPVTRSWVSVWHMHPLVSAVSGFRRERFLW